MDSKAHTIIQQARTTLIDGLRLYKVGYIGMSDQERAEFGGLGLDAQQFRALVNVTQELLSLMVDDPRPPECTWCGTPLVQPKTGRPRLTCSDACRVAQWRERAGVDAWREEQVPQRKGSVAASFEGLDRSGKVRS